MDESITAIGFTPDIRVSPKPAILALAIAGALVGAIGGVPRLTLVTLPIALLMLALAGIAWALEGWRPRLGAAFSVFSLMVVVLLARYWLGVEGALILLALPTAFAAAVIGLPAGLLSAAGSTALLVALWQTAFSPTWGGGLTFGGAAPSEIGLTLVLVWTVTAVQWAMIRPVQHIVAWSWDHYRQAQGTLDEALSHRAQLAQALNDLAQANR